jgi:NADP-dependent 3-hydroxy acid dehydrogenase YdfG
MGVLDGQVAIVTGGGSGIGRATARMLAAEGAQVVVSGRRQGPLDETVAEIARAGGTASARVADMESPTDPAALAAWTIETFGRVDVLINNAGHSSTIRAIRWVRKADWDSVLAANVTGVYLITQAVLPGMIEHGGGTIVTVSSVAGIRPGLMGGVPYSAAKAAVRNLMGHIHSEHRDKGIGPPPSSRRGGHAHPRQAPAPPGARARSTMMQPEDVARAIMLCVTLPPRTVIEEIVMVPTVQRDVSEDIRVASAMGGPGNPG